MRWWPALPSLLVVALSGCYLGEMFLSPTVEVGGGHAHGDTTPGGAEYRSDGLEVWAGLSLLPTHSTTTLTNPTVIERVVEREVPAIDPRWLVPAEPPDDPEDVPGPWQEPDAEPDLGDKAMERASTMADVWLALIVIVALLAAAFLIWKGKMPWIGKPKEIAKP